MARSYPYGFWSKKENCQEAALLCITRNELQKKFRQAYRNATKYGWLDEICAHMIKVGSKYERAIYVIEFPDKSVYVGLTHDYLERYGAHARGSSNANVRERMEQGLDFSWIEFGEWLPPAEAASEEDRIIEDYRCKGYKILNSIRAGGLGGCHHEWTKEEVQEIANRYTKRSHFYRNHRGAYKAAKRNGWLDEVCSHMSYNYGQWTKPRVLAAFKECGNRTAFSEEYPGAYEAARRGRYLNELGVDKRTVIKWTKSSIIEAARTCKDRGEFQKKFGAAYRIASRDEYLDECYKHMGTRKQRTSKWSEARILEVAAGCETRGEFKKNFPAAEKQAYALGIMDKVRKVIPDQRERNG